MNNLIEYRGLVEDFKNKSITELKEELKDVESRKCYGLNGVRQMLVANCIKQAIKEKQ